MQTEAIELHVYVYKYVYIYILILHPLPQGMYTFSFPESVIGGQVSCCYRVCSECAGSAFAQFMATFL